MECRWWDSNPHGFPSDFESLASAIPPHRLIWIWMRFARFFGSWRDVQEGCWNLSTANRSKTFAASLKFQMGARSREADFELLSSSSIWCHPVISSDIWCPLCKGKIHVSMNNNLKYPRFFDAFSLYSVFSVWTA